MTRAHWRPAYIGIGSNLESPAEQVRRGIEALAKIPCTKVLLNSRRYRSKPICGADQPDFINAVSALLTQLDPRELLRHLQQIEESHGRDRSVERWGPRTLDLDLLAFSGLQLDDDDLTIPHPGIAERNFVLLPWREIAPCFRVPGLSTIERLASQLSSGPVIERID